MSDDSIMVHGRRYETGTNRCRPIGLIINNCGMFLKEK